MAEARGAASYAAVLAADALAAGDALAAAGPLSPDTRALYLDAQAAYERHHGPRAEAAGEAGLSAAEFATLRGPLLAAVTEDGAATLPLTDAQRALAFDFARYPVPAELESVVEQQRRLFSRPRLYSGIQKNTARYFPMIERVFAEEGIPETLKFVAVIESGLNPRAVSHAEAGGMWQFLEETGQRYGLRANDRFHPERSTRAAARFSTTSTAATTATGRSRLPPTTAGPTAWTVSCARPRPVSAARRRTGTSTASSRARRASTCPAPSSPPSCSARRRAIPATRACPRDPV